MGLSTALARALAVPRARDIGIDLAAAAAAHDLALARVLLPVMLLSLLVMVMLSSLMLLVLVSWLELLLRLLLLLPTALCRD
eukprot:7210861-Alexandrium_andersonii.AAC.1